MMKILEFFHKLLGGRDYKVINGEMYVKEGFGDWEKIDLHLRDNHPELYDNYIEEKRRK
jgi:hypothetical protein